MNSRLPIEVTIELKHLRNRVEELEAELRRRDAVFHADVQKLRSHLKLSVGEAAIVALLADGNAHSREQMMEACDTDANSERSIDSFMKRIRKKGQLTFRAEYGLGYALSAESFQLVRKILKGDMQ